jgi:cellulose synthase/poly-beta-1,6-N-acetylglucosamine synthase-like glycosyltransferase
MYSFFAPQIYILYDFYAVLGFWPFNPQLLLDSVFSGALLNALLNPMFFLTFIILTLAFIVFFWHSFYFGYLFLSSIGIGKALPVYEPTVTVLLPALNEEQHIGATLDALLRSTYPKDKLELLVIASGSTDNTAKIARAKGKRGPIKVLTKALPRKGKPSALHLGLSQAKHEVIFICDAETRLEPDALSHLVRPLQLDGVLATQGSTQVENAGVNKLTRAQALANAWHDGGGLYQELQTKRGRPFFLLGKNYCVRKKLLDELGGYAGDALTEDIRVSFQLLEMEGRFAFVPRARAWEDVPTTMDVLAKQRARWTAGWNVENSRRMETTKNKRSAIIGLIEFLVLANFVAFYPVFGTIIGLSCFLFAFLGPMIGLSWATNGWLFGLIFFVPAIFCFLLAMVSARRYAKRTGLITSFLSFFKLYWYMFRTAMKPSDIPETWEKTEKE